MEKVIVGPCECGGYGVVYNETWEEIAGTCHTDIEDFPTTDYTEDTVNGEER